MLIEVMVLSSRQLFLTACYNPETLSRVTLASLGIAFQAGLSVLARLRLFRHVQNLSRITRMRRICSLTDFYCVVGFLCASRALWLSRIISCWAVGLSARSVQRKHHPTRLRLKKHPCQSYKSVFEKKTQWWNEHGLNGYNGFVLSRIISCWRLSSAVRRDYNPK